MSTPPFQPPPPSPPSVFVHPAHAAPPPGSGTSREPLKRPAGVIIIGILNLLGGVGALLSAAITAVGGATTVGSETPGLVMVVVALGGVMALAGALLIATGVGLLTLKPWGRTLQMVLSAIGLLGIPIGTVINGVILYYLTRPGLKLLFSGRPAESFTYDERQAMARGSGQGVMIAVVVGVLFFGGIMMTGVIAAIAIPGLLRARMAGNESSAIGTLRAMNSGQAVWASAVGRGEYGEPHCLGAPESCGAPAGASFVSADIANLEERSGYRFGFALRKGASVAELPAPVEGEAAPDEPSDAEVQRQLEGLSPAEAQPPDPSTEPPAESAPAVLPGYAYWAIPVDFDMTGTRIFCTDETGLILQYEELASWTDPSPEDARCPSGGTPLQ